ncbi:uncharacterized protein V6R79_014099 [Siganus canaliculatus]
MEWLSENVQIEEKAVKLGEIFSFSSEKGLLCKTCSDAKVASKFSEGKTWIEWKLDYLKRHVQHKSHLKAVGIVRRLKMGQGIGTLLRESAKGREKRNELSHKTKSDPEQFKVLIDNILLAIKMNASMLSVQQIHDHMAKEENDVNYKTVFGGIIQLTACTAQDIVQGITQFYSKHGLDMQKMVILTSDGASVMLGKHNGVAALLKRQIPHLTEQHCVAHREDLGIDDAWKNVPLMRDVETLLRTVYSTFSRSAVKRGKMEDLAKILDEDALSFRPLNEVRWLSRHQAVNAVLRNYTVLTEFCKREFTDNRDPVEKYCYKKLSDSNFKVTVTALGDVLGELAQLCLTLQRRNLTVMEGHCFARAKIEKLRSQYLKEKDVQWSDRVDRGPWGPHQLMAEILVGLLFLLVSCVITWMLVFQRMN